VRYLKKNEDVIGRFKDDKAILNPPRRNRMEQA
jgi:hypothetical protein